MERPWTHFSKGPPRPVEPSDFLGDLGDWTTDMWLWMLFSRNPWIFCLPYFFSLTLFFNQEIILEYNMTFSVTCLIFAIGLEDLFTVCFLAKLCLVLLASTFSLRRRRISFHGCVFPEFLAISHRIHVWYTYIYLHLP